MRYLPLTDADRRAMLAKIGVADIDALFADIPKDKRLEGLIDLPKAKGEMEVERVLGKLAAQNTPAGSVPFFVGAGAYKHHVPATRRSPDPALRVPHLLHALSAGDRPGHAAVPVRVPDPGGDADGHGGGERLHVRRLDGDGRSRADGAPHHQAAQGGAGRQPASALPRDHRDGGAAGRARGRRAAAGACGQAGPGGADRRHRVVRRRADAGLLRPSARPHRHRREGARGRRAADRRRSPRSSRWGWCSRPAPWVPTSSSARAKSIGNALAFGGPYVGLFATRTKYVRQMPGRLCGETVDKEGRRGFVLTLSTREQHIRREKATSNICTNSGLCVLAFTIHMSAAGRGRAAAARAHQSRQRRGAGQGAAARSRA